MRGEEDAPHTGATSSYAAPLELRRTIASTTLANHLKPAMLFFSYTRVLQAPRASFFVPRGRCPCHTETLLACCDSASDDITRRGGGFSTLIFSCSDDRMMMMMMLQLATKVEMELSLHFYYRTSSFTIRYKNTQHLYLSLSLSPRTPSVISVPLFRPAFACLLYRPPRPGGK